MEPSRLPDEGSNTYRDLHRPFLLSVSIQLVDRPRIVGSLSPEVVGAVFVRHDDHGHLGIGFDRVHAVRGVGEMLLDVGAEALQSRFAATRSACCLRKQQPWLRLTPDLLVIPR